MNVATTLRIFRERSHEQSWRDLLSLAPPVVLAFLVLLTARQLASMTWTIAPSESFDLPASFAPAPRASTALPSTPTGTSFLAPPAALGDDEQVRAPAASVSAPISSPRLTLSGTIGGTSASTIGFAIISSSEQGARLYRVGEAIDGAPAVTVQMIEADRVTLNHGGTLETLWLSATSDE